MFGRGIVIVVTNLVVMVMPVMLLVTVMGTKKISENSKSCDFDLCDEDHDQYQLSPLESVLLLFCSGSITRSLIQSIRLLKDESWK